MKTHRMMAATVLAGLITAPVFAAATDYCIESGGGWPGGGKQGASGCPFSSGSDQGAFSGVAKPETCSSTLLNLPATHD